MDVKRKFNISLNEYALLVVVSNLSNKANYPWCEASREDLSACVDISKQAVITMIDRLVDRGLLEKDRRGKVRSTIVWEDAVSVVVPNRHDSVKELVQDGKGSLPPTKGKNKGEKESTNVLPVKPKTSYKEISSFLEEVKSILKLDEFADSVQFTRIFAYNILRKFGRADALKHTKQIMEQWGEQYRPTTTRTLFYSITKIKEKNKNSNSYKQY